MKLKKIMVIVTIIVAILLVSIPTTQVIAGPTSFNNMLNWDFSNPTLPTKLSKIIGAIIALLRNVSIIITVGVLTILGVKYMLGSVSEKADYKKDFPNIMIGLVLVSGAFTIVSVIFSIAEGL